MKHNEVKDRIFLVKASPRLDRASVQNVRKRGENKIEKTFNTMEEFDDFFEYEKDLSELKPARETLEFDFHKREEDFLDQETSFIIMKKITKEEDTTNDSYDSVDIINNNVNSTDTVLNEPENISNDLIDMQIVDDEDAIEDIVEFEFKQCAFRKEDNFRCKKQVKRGTKYCGLHHKYINKNK